MSHRVLYVALSFLSGSGYFYFSLDFHSDAWIKCLEIFLLSFCYLFLIGFRCAGDYTTLPIIFKFLRFVLWAKRWSILCYVLPALEKKVRLLWLGEAFSGCRVEPVVEDVVALLSVLTHLLLGCCAAARAVLRSPAVLVDVSFLHMLCSSDVVSIH